MATCGELEQSMAVLKRRLAVLERTGKGHSLQHQDLLDELAQLDLDYRGQGCGAPPVPRLGQITTTVIGGPVTVEAGGTGDLSINIEAVNDSGVATSADYTIDPPVTHLAQSGSWTVPIPPGVSTQQATLTFAAADSAAAGTLTVAIHESVVFGPVKDGAHQQYDYVLPDPTVVIGVNPAGPAIDAKAAALGAAFTGAAVETVQHLIWGTTPADGPAFRRRYENCTIYYSAAFGAHEIHGDIRAKFDRLPDPTTAGVPVVLGIPVTDEMGCPDGQGRYNHFSNGGSIYWHPELGPFAVYGALRDRWARDGWETGPLGYPTRDQYIPGPNELSYNIFALFQDGALWLNNDVGELPALKQFSAEQIRDLIWQQFNQQLPGQTVRIDVGPATVVGQPGLEAQTSTDNVTGNAYGFWHARNRIMTVTLHGFVSLNWGLPDPTFDAHLDLLLYEDNQSHPADQSGPPNNQVGQGDHYLYAALTGLRVDAHGVSNERVAATVQKVINDTLRVPLQVPTAIPQPPDLFGLCVTAVGGVDLLYHPRI